jgi:hypothetical protein
MIDTSIVRVHQHGACITRNRRQSTGRSRGGLTSTPHRLSAPAASFAGDGRASGIAVGWPLAASAQQGRRVRTIGMLMNFLENDPAGQVGVVAFRDALKELGWREGSDLRIEIRWAESDPEWNFWECATGTVP